MPIPVPGRLAESVRQGVVQVRSAERSLGSGVVVGPGRVVTNAHVVRDAVVKVESWEGDELRASVLKMNRSRDLALLSVAGLKVHALPLGESQGLRAGTPVFAIGNPMGFVGAVSSGVIHHGIPMKGLDRWLCADVHLAPGNSGGPLTNFSGQVVGINTMVVSGGLALAVPSRAVQKFLKHEDARSLGVVVRGVRFGSRMGVLVTGIVPDSAAERASLLPGDILIAANDLVFSHPDDLTDAIDGAADGLLRLEFLRGDHFTARHVTADLLSRGVRTAA